MIKRIGIIQAIKAINPDAQVTVYGEDYDTIDWNAGTAVISKEDIEQFFQSLTQNLNSCVHVTVKYGDNDHHKIEAAIKSLAVAVRNASTKDKKQKGIPSTKGAM